MPYRYYEEGDSEDDGPRRPSRGIHNRHSSYSKGNDYLHTSGGGTDLHRARSQGHGPAPNIHIHNRYDAMQEGVGSLQPPGDRGRDSSRRSRSRSDVPRYYQSSSREHSPYSPGFDRDRELKFLELQRKIEEEEIEKEKRRAVDDYKRKSENEERERKAMFDRMKQEEADKKKKEEERRKEAIRLWQQEQEDKKKKEKEEEEEWERRRKRKEQEQKEKEEKEHKEYLERVRKDFGKFGLSDEQIEYMIKHDERKKHKEDRLEAEYEMDHHHHGHKRRSGHKVSDALVVKEKSSHKPIFPKVKRADLAVDTLKYYDLPWEYDYDNPDYIIILKELTEHDTDVLFEHTRRLRSRKTLALTMEDKKGDKPEYAWVRRRNSSAGKKSRSKSRERSRSTTLSLDKERSKSKSPRRERFAESVLGIR